MGRQIVRTEISLGLDNPADSLASSDAADDKLTQELMRHALGVAVIEGCRKNLHGDDDNKRRASAGLDTSKGEKTASSCLASPRGVG